MERRRLLDNPQLDPSIVFYAPLGQGDTTDHISGNDVTVDSYGALSWNNSESAWYFNGSYYGYYSKSLFAWKNLDMGIFSSSTTAANVVFTISAKIKVQSANDIGTSRFIPSFSYVQDGSHYLYAFASRGAFWNASIDGQWHEYTLRVSNGSAECMLDGVLKNTYSMSMSQSGFVVADTDNYLAVYSLFNANKFGGSAYIKNVIVYNRALTDAEIAQL